MTLKQQIEKAEELIHLEIKRGLFDQEETYNHIITVDSQISTTAYNLAISNLVKQGFLR